MPRIKWTFVVCVAFITLCVCFQNIFISEKASSVPKQPPKSSIPEEKYESQLNNRNKKIQDSKETLDYDSQRSDSIGNDEQNDSYENEESQGTTTTARNYGWNIKRIKRIEPEKVRMPSASKSFCASDLSSESLKQWKHFMVTQLKSDVTLSEDMDLLYLLDATRFNDSDIVRNKTQHEIGKGYKHDVNYYRDADTNQLKFNIEERYHGNLTDGGSEFRITVTGNNIHYDITLVDHFNGTYTGCGKFPPECVNINVQLWFTNFTAFGLGLRDVISISNTSLCPQGKDKALADYLFSLQKASEKTECRNFDFSAPHAAKEFVKTVDMRSMRKQMRFTPVSQDGCVLQEYSFEKIKKCFKKITHLTILGDSHLRYAFNYMLEALGNLTEKVPKDFEKEFVSNNITFSVSLFPHNIAWDLGKITDSASRDVSASSRTIVLLNSGWWPNQYHNVVYIAHQMEHVYSAIERFKNDPRWRHARLIWYGTPAYPNRKEWMYKPPIDGYVNNYKTAALNKWVHDRLMGLGVEYVDNLQYGYARPYDNVCKAHWLCRHDIKQTVFALDAGLNMIDVLMHKICDWYES